MAREYHTLIVDPDGPSRLRLRAALQVLPEFRRVSTSLQFTDCAGRVTEPVDIVFLSARFPLHELQQLLAKAKRTPNLASAAFIIVQQASAQTSANAASQVLAGVDGMLNEPFSVDALAEIVVLAERVKTEQQRARERAAIDLLAREICEQLNMVSAARARGEDAGISARALRETCSVIRTLEAEALDYYFEALTSACATSPPRPQVAYCGASARVRRRMRQRGGTEEPNQAHCEAGGEDAAHRA